MPYYLKYHVLSGAVENKFSVPTAEHLIHFRQDGFDFLEVDHETQMDCYIKDGALCTPAVVTRPLPNVSVGVDEEAIVAGLPVGSWAQLDTGELVPVDADGSLVLFRSEEDNFNVRLVGAYTSVSFRVEWIGLDTLKARSKEQVDRDAEAARARVVTPGSGQAMTYLRKADAARAMLEGLPISAAQAQRIHDEALRLGCDDDEAATVIVNQADRWESLDAEIDSIRLTAKYAIGEAETGAAITSVLTGIEWPV